MRAELVFMALAHESNRYRLSRIAAKATRKLHRPNTRVQDTMNDALQRLAQEAPAGSVATGTLRKQEPPAERRRAA